MKQLSIIILSAVTVFTACKNRSDFQKTVTGLEYKIHLENKDGAKAKEGDFVNINFSWRNDKDSLIQSSQSQPFKITKHTTYGDFMDGFILLGAGDSATFLVSVDSMFKGSQIPPIATPGTFWKFDLKVKEVMNEQQVQDKMMGDQMKTMQEQQQQLEQDIKTIENYLAENKITAKRTESGIFYTIEKEGKGEQASLGKTVSVHYNGTLLNGTKFDSSRDKNEPITVILGQTQMIKGWDEGIALFKKGGKGKLYIPSPLAFGKQHRSELIVPNSILIFDIELMDVK